MAGDDSKIPVRSAIFWAERTGVRASRKASGLAGYPKLRWPGWRGIKLNHWMISLLPDRVDHRSAER